MAVTGIIMVAYLITHVLANLLVFQGPRRINAYSRVPPRDRRGALGRAAGAARRRGGFTSWRRCSSPRGGGRRARWATRQGATRRSSTFASRTIRWGGVADSRRSWSTTSSTSRCGTVAPLVRRRRPLSQRGRGLRQSGGGAVLRARDGRGRAAPVPRHLEQWAQPRDERAVAASAAAAAGAGAGAAGLGSVSPSFRSRCTGECWGDPG